LDRTLLKFRFVVVLAIVAAFGQVTLGGVVRVTDSGLGCPDWPLCHGRLLPSFDRATLIEYSHRLSASLLTVLVLATAALAWRHYRDRRWIVLPSALALGLVVSAAMLGAATVLTELSSWFVLLHLGIAEMLIGALVVAAIASWSAASPLQEANFEPRPRTAFEWVIPYTIVGVLAVVLWGSYMVGYGAGSVCSTWPLCRGSLFPDGTAFAIHMGHRLFAAVVGLLVVGTSFSAWSNRHANPAVAWTGAILLAVYALQSLLGAVTVWAGFPAEMKALHLSVATLVWITLIVLATMVYSPGRHLTPVAPALSHQRA
jgi:heme A synthase